MNKKLFFTLLLPLAAGAAPLCATSLTNSDQLNYTVSIKDKNGEKTVSIAREATLENICDGCTISSPDLGQITAKPEDEALIVDGVLMLSLTPKK